MTYMFKSPSYFLLSCCRNTGLNCWFATGTFFIDDYVTHIVCWARIASLARFMRARPMHIEMK